MASNYNVQVVGSFVDKISGPMSAIKTGIGALIATVAAVGTASLKTGSDMETLYARLKTATGSSESAAEALEFVTELTKKIPGSVEDTTNAFIQLTNLGLAPTEEAIMSYANTAAAMGKPLSQFVEAVADATTNEFERLKEFGVKTKTVGENVEFTFQGMTTTVGKNSTEIRDYLEGLGNVQFAGAAEEQLNTLSGIMSNVGVEIQGYLQDLNNEAGLVDMAKDGAKAFINFVKIIRQNVGPVFTFLKDQGEVWFDLLSNQLMFIGSVFSDIGSIFANVINTIFGGESSSMIGAWFSDWRARMADIQKFFIFTFSAIQTVIARVQYAFRVAAINIIGFFHKLTDSWESFFITLGNTLIDGVNFQLRNIVLAVNTVITALNKIPKVDIDLINVDSVQIERIKEVAEGINEVTEAMKADALAEYEDRAQAISDRTFELASSADEASKKELELNLQLEEGVSKTDEYNDKLKKNREEKDKNVKASEELSEANENYIETLDGVRGASQSVLGSFFTDIAEGSKDAFANLVENFRKAVTAMIAEALAAKIVRSLFGEDDTTGSIGGSSAGAGIISGLFGREHGGNVSKNMPYIVGEKRPEVFIPDSDGMIINDTNQMARTAGGNMSVTINAIDSSGVADFIETNKFALTGAVLNTSQRYNIGR